MNNPEPDAAVEMIRQKLAGLYANEPDVKKEIQESIVSPHRSKHQQYMYELSNSGKSLAEIQTAWHAYYQNLPDAQKHEVWHEFYRQYDNQRLPDQKTKVLQPVASGAREPQALSYKNPVYGHASNLQPRPVPAIEPSPPRTVAQLKKSLLKNVSHSSSRKRKENLKSLGFGLACGFVTLLIFLFGFFNERFLAPFITPSRSVSNAPIVIDAASAPASNEPLIIIPKINVQIPVVYNEPSVDEEAVQRALEHGVLHYATTPKPGEQGNGVIFGHSSNNIFNKGKYKFAFVLLKRMEPGDTFTVQKDGKRYVYKVYEKRIVSPNDLSVLAPQAGKTATMALITCDPPGTSINRLVVFGEQISPDPASNKPSVVKGANQTPVILPSNAPSVWSRLINWLSS